MDNPYQSPTDTSAANSWRDVLARTAAIALHLLLWIAFIVLTGPILRQALGPSPLAIGEMESQPTMLQSYSQFIIRYGFLPLMLGFVVDVGVWIVLRRRGRRVRWKWFAITSLAIPVVAIATWLTLRPVLLME